MPTTPQIFNFQSSIFNCAEGASPASHEAHHFKRVAVPDNGRTVPLLFHDHLVQFHRHALMLYLELFEQTEDGDPVGELFCFSIQPDIHALHQQKKPRGLRGLKALQMIYSVAFPTPALPGSGSKGRPKGLSAMRLPQQYVKLKYSTTALKSIDFVPEQGITRSDLQANSVR
jgi:hypothetical protein